MNKEQNLMQDTTRTMATCRTYTLDINKIKTLEDVIKVIDGLSIQITLAEGTTSDVYEKLKGYLI